jgi:hypothetical protein
MEATGLSQGDLGKAIGRSGPTLNAWLKDRYEGDNLDLERRLRSYLEKVRGRGNVTPRAVTFIPTWNAQALFAIADRCAHECELGVVTADAGMGKTTALMEYARLHPEVIYVPANLCFTARVLFIFLCDTLGLSTAGSVHEMFRRVVEKLDKSDRLIMVDQAEYLPYRALELLRSVYDEAQVGILLVGMDRLYHNLKKDKGEFAQLYSRVAVYHKLSYGLREEEIKAMVESRLPGAKVDWQLFKDPCRGNARSLDKLCKAAKWEAHANNTGIDEAIVKKASQILIR